ncbi:Tol-Pal system beta propeller repeat protein TolB [Suttonella ornithocola]|uniref:Tol-Pal system protein TolB n=1 Tax=Suttonella ornithocola TaxID=279832 RepID=A0A380MND6_9GAMM|nr:Tol-Pal system beta propeller repeat protein TolB [Suttonella ornithocola]SUO93251.1 translocation protein TolB [Suttonella ornithocola]
MNRLKLFALACFLPTAWAVAQVSINIPEAQKRAAQPIAVVPVQNDQGDKIDYIIASDLHKSGFFQPISPDKFPSRPKSPAEINYPEFQQLGANYIVLGRVLQRGTNARAQFVLNQTNNQAVLFNEELRGANTRQLAHAAADLILEKLTGKRGAFGTQVAYVLEQVRGKNRRYSLIVSDADGGNRREIASGNQPILSPSWAPDSRQIAYMTYANNHAQIVVQSASGGGARVVVRTEGTSSAPSWSPDGRQLAISQADANGNMDIYLVDVGSGVLHRLTNNASIDTEPTFSPDGRTIYFTSDRAGTPQIYRMNRGGGGVQRAVVGGNYSSNAELSPDGKYLALTRQSGGGYQIGLYNLQNGRFSALTNGRLDEGATFAPNGELLMYTAIEGGRSVLKMINLKGQVVQTLSDPSGRLRDPAWAPDRR